jgi:hypothetical protein
MPAVGGISRHIAVRRRLVARRRDEFPSPGCYDSPSAFRAVGS